MADIQTQIKSQMAAAVAATVADPNVKAEESSIPALIGALAPIAESMAATVLNSTNNEPFYQSRVFWGSTVAIIGVGLNYFHVDFPAALQGQVTDAIMSALPIAASLYALYGRFKAKKPLGS